MQNLIIYKASAGSGKTYKLTEEYLRLAFRKPFHNILAVTFTNKATAEMKDRITGVLDSLAKGKDSPYLEILKEDTGLEEVAIREKARSLLDDILQNYSRFSVGTIDSFFQRVIRGFARETGLQSGFELELDNRKVLEKVIDRLMIETETNSGLRKWMIRYAGDRIREGKSWNFRQDIGRLGKQVFNETFMEFRQEMSEKLSDREFMTDYMDSLRALRDGFEKQMDEIGGRGLKFMGERGLSVADFAYGSRGVAGYFEKITADKKYEPPKRVLDAADDPGLWVSKKSVKREEITSAVEEGLIRILNQALELYGKSWPLYVSSKLVLSNFYTLGILNDIARQIREYANENNLFLLSDVASLLSGIIGANDAPFIYEKTGHFYRHFMIDEFQDTSAIQWKNFVPLITNSLAENNRNILVGDVKQSIYRWRNGDWRILATGIQEDLKVFTPQVRTLEVNWRSKKDIVEFNNSFFRYSPDVIQEQFRSEYLDAGLPEDFADDMTEQIGKAYAEQAQKLPEREGREGGFVNIRFPGNNDRDWKEKVLRDLPGLIKNILSRGYSRKDIAILVRNRRDGNEIAKALMDWQAEHGMESAIKLEFISEEFLLLQESVSIRLLMALMRYLVDPSDRINKAVILNEYHRYLHADIESQVPDQELFGSIAFSKEDRSDNLLPDDFVSRKEELGQLSLYELVEQLIAVFGLSDRDSELPYLMAFQDVVLDYSRKEGSGVAPFIEWWQEHSSNLSVSSNERQDAMRIMTIHKAKGLQFKVVLIPFADWDIDHNPLHDNFLWCRPVIKPFEKLDLVPVKYSKELAGSIFARDYFNEKMQVFVDNLNLLYVAFTRAEEELYAFTPLPEEKKADKGTVKSISGLLYRILPAGKTEEDSAGTASRQEYYSDRDAVHGDADKTGTGRSDIKAADDRQGNLTNAGDHETNPENTAGQLIDAISHDIDSAITGGKWNDEEKSFTMGKKGEPSGTGESTSDDELIPVRYHVNDFMNKLRLRPYGNLFFSGDADTGKRIDYGKLMHEIFENIITSKDIEKAVMQKCHQGIISRKEAGEMIDTIGRITGKKEVARWFDGSWRVRNETAILLKGGKTRRPDRVMIKEGQVVVVDYKFGGQLQPRYRNQVRRYMTELKEMGYSNLKGYVWYPLIDKIDEVDIINPELEFE